MLLKHIFEYVKLIIKQVKEKEFYFQLNIIETEKRLDEWYYRGRKILKERNKQEKTLKNNYDNSIIKHLEFKKTL